MIPDDVLRKALAEAMGPDNVLLAADLDWDLQQPCNDCPFLRSASFHEGVAKHLPLHIEAIDAGIFAHTCHKTDQRPSCDGPHTWRGRPKHCAGAILMLLKTGDGKDLQLPLLQAAEAGKLDLEAMVTRAVSDDRVYTLPELLRFYTQQLARLWRERRKRTRKVQRRGNPQE